MAPKGRPRLTPEAYQARLDAYCARYQVTPSADGLAPFPAGRRETPQHREWLSLYKAHNRLMRRGRGQCERCPAPVVDGSVFCEVHKAEATAPGRGTQAGTAERRRLLKTQRGRCPICSERLPLADSLDHARAGDAARSVLHRHCAQLLASLETAGLETLERAKAYLWPADKPRPMR